MGRLFGLLRGEGAGGQFLSQIKEIGWRLRKIGGRKGDGLSQRGRIRIRRAIIFHGPGSFVEARRRQWLGQWIGQLQ